MSIFVFFCRLACIGVSLDSRQDISDRIFKIATVFTLQRTVNRWFWTVSCFGLLFKGVFKEIQGTGKQLCEI
ncbi:hypothetical protein AB685_08350 [Bacillus sp. LL01]|nr:hypothetical protein AB685_08350 [Bacillus sp. LL01]